MVRRSYIRRSRHDPLPSQHNTLVYTIMAHTSTTSTLPSMTALPTALTAERDAGAAWRVLAEQAHLAANVERRLND